MCSISTFAKDNGRLSLSLQKKVVTHIYGYFDQPNKIPEPTGGFSYKTGQIRVGKEFYAHPLSLQDPTCRLKMPTYKHLKEERLRTLNLVVQSIQNLVENHAHLYWHGPKHENYVQKMDIQRNLEERLKVELEICFNAGAMEGQELGRKTIERIFGSSPESTTDYFFSKHAPHEAVVPSSNKKSLPLTVITPWEMENLHWEEVEDFKEDLETLESAIEASLISKTFHYLSEEDKVNSQKKQEYSRFILNSAVWKTLQTAFQLGKHYHFKMGQMQQKMALGFEHDLWVYRFVHKPDQEKIFVRKQPFVYKKKRTRVVHFEGQEDFHEPPAKRVNTEE